MERVRSTPGATAPHSEGLQSIGPARHERAALAPASRRGRLPAKDFRPSPTRTECIPSCIHSIDSRSECVLETGFRVCYSNLNATYIRAGRGYVWKQVSGASLYGGAAGTQRIAW